MRNQSPTMPKYPTTKAGWLKLWSTGNPETSAQQFGTFNALASPEENAAFREALSDLAPAARAAVRNEMRLHAKAVFGAIHHVATSATDEQVRRRAIDLLAHFGLRLSDVVELTPLQLCRALDSYFRRHNGPPN